MDYEPEEAWIEILGTSDHATVRGHSMFAENRRAVILAVPRGISEEELRELAPEVLSRAMAEPENPGAS